MRKTLRSRPYPAGQLVFGTITVFTADVNLGRHAYETVLRDIPAEADGGVILTSTGFQVRWKRLGGIDRQESSGIDKRIPP